MLTWVDTTSRIRRRGSSLTFLSGRLRLTAPPDVRFLVLERLLWVALRPSLADQKQSLVGVGPVEGITLKCYVVLC